MTGEPSLPPLSETERAFVAAYLANGRKAAAAWRVLEPNAGPRASPRAARCLARPAVQAALAAADQEAQARTRALIERYAITEERVLAELANVAFSRPLDLLRLNPDGTAVVDLTDMDEHQAAAIAEVTVDEYMDGKGNEARPVKRIRVKLADKLRALNLLGHRLGLWKPTANADPSNNGAGLSALLDEALREEEKNRGKGEG
ncbi:terminase small subunit [Pararhodospirillum photometricum]|nr:terminase small subunit [Pararhodospirillum photometricum]